MSQQALWRARAARGGACAARAPWARAASSSHIAQRHGRPAAPPGTTTMHGPLAAAITLIAMRALPRSLSTLAPEAGVLPALDWFGGDIPQDWLDVKAGCSSASSPYYHSSTAAVGDGVADDTAAIQACFDMVSNETKKYTVYLPEGSYKVTATLRLFRGISISILGQGEGTRLIWGGPLGGRMLVSDGLSRSTFAGLVFDGCDAAAVGFEHDAHRPGLFETRIRHQNSRFENFLQAGIRIGANRTTGKLETSEVLYENMIFANNGNQDSVAFNCTRFGGCGGILILNFNDYDNTFDGCHFFNNSWGIYTSAMANVYVRNSRFDSNGRAFVHRVGPSVQTFVSADIMLAPSAGNSVRRCVSVNAGGAFVASPHHTAVNPTTIEGCVIDSWRGPAAIAYQLRGPLTVLDNAFTNGSHALRQVKPCQEAYQCAHTRTGAPCWLLPCPMPMDYSPWKQTNGIAFASGNTIDAKPVSLAGLQAHPATNTQLIDIPTSTATKFTNPLTPQTHFLKTWWPIPTALVDARSHGCTGAEADSTSCAQATIDAAAQKGEGAAAYFPPGTYKISTPLVVKGGNYTLRGSGIRTVFVWSKVPGSKASLVDPDPAVIHVIGGGGGLRVEQLQVVSSATIKGGTGFTPTVLHDGHREGGGGDRTTIYDGLYTSTGAGGCSWKNGCWNATGMVVKDLPKGDVVHFIHLDGNLKIHDSAAGTVFANFMIQGSLNISGNVRPRADREYPSVAMATMVGLTDHDLNIHDDQSAVMTDYYSEQIKTGHAFLSGNGASHGQAGGRVTVAAVKSNCYTNNEITIDNWHGTVAYSNSFFFEGPPVQITQRGGAIVNVTMWGNAFWYARRACVCLRQWDGALIGVGRRCALCEARVPGPSRSCSSAPPRGGLL